MHGTAAQSLSVVPFSQAPSSQALSLTFEQAPEGSGRFVLLGLAATALTLLLMPFGLVVAQLASDASARAILAQHPLLGAQLGVGFLVLMVLFGWPLAHLSRRALVRRQITIEDGRVTAAGLGRFGGGAWTEPLEAYRGVAPRIRSSLSGVCHELVLIHPRPERCVVLYSGPSITPDLIAAASRLLSVAEIPSREAASLAPLHGLFRPAEPQPRLAA
jgi:hypothetical protein